MPEDSSQGQKKINSFADAYGTILYFDEINTVKAMQKQYALYGIISRYKIAGKWHAAVCNTSALANMGLG